MRPYFKVMTFGESFAETISPQFLSQAAMPYVPLPTSDSCYVIFIGQCTYDDSVAYTKYVFVCIRGEFTLEEANTFLVAMMDDRIPPRSHLYFAHTQVLVNSMTYYTFDNDPGCQGGLRWYIDHYSTLFLLSQYEWQIARHDIYHLLRTGQNLRRLPSRVPFGSRRTDHNEVYPIAPDVTL